MVSQEGTLYSRKRDFTIYGEEFNNSFKKRKQEEQSQSTLFNEQPNFESMRSVTFDCQKSIEAKGYTKKYEDQRTYLKDPVVLGRPKMSLDLELNLSPSYSPSKTTMMIDESLNHNETMSSKGKNMLNSSKKSIIRTGLSRSLSWLALEGDDDDDDDDDDHKEKEMVTKVCMKCHMLVMLCKSTPICPNCKFMHPHEHSSTKLFKPSNLLRLLC